jgi:Na+-translocating ferredoxin:NAD+ oxidoreductase RnfA subunit
MLQFALGASHAKGKVIPFTQIVILFVSAFLLWIVYRYILIFLPWEIMAFILLFPFSALVCLFLESLEKRLLGEKKYEKLYSCNTAYEGLVPASLILCVHLSVTIADALFLSFFFALGSLVAIVIMKEINRRASLESIPKNLRGMPLAFISMGLLSMVFGSTAWICYRFLNGF